MKPVELFRDEAKRFCALVEQERFEIQDLLSTLVQLLSLGLGLPHTEPESSDLSPDPDGLDANVSAVAANARRTFGVSDLYWEIFDPRVRGKPVAGALCDDVAETYQDVRRGLHVADSVSLSEAAWEWRFLMQAHWGIHATDAIRVLFRLVND